MAKQKYWYICYVHYCPVCGHERRFRERVYEKPENYWIWEEFYDWCDAL